TGSACRTRSNASPGPRRCGLSGAHRSAASDRYRRLRSFPTRARARPRRRTQAAVWPMVRARRARSVHTVAWLTNIVEKAKKPPMIRFASLALALAACGRSSGVSDEELGGLVVAVKPAKQSIDVDLAAKEPAELGRALMQPYHFTTAAIGP